LTGVTGRVTEWVKIHHDHIVFGRIKSTKIAILSRYWEALRGVMKRFQAL